ncbi:hypothetical protein HOLleu_38508 [Holothuria leucospilota]|uniref:Uncharacterized protein n=1 Tax=Holothuria leucospilota TaxID=206669 RepID=A0A9Q0YH18_HOLLE|nr:hypothetical protein HOLleu_38508 [Holothuria leucospilota]
MTSRELYCMLALWFIHQSLPYIQAQPNNAPALESKATSNQLPENNELRSHHGKAVLSEEQNQHCFKTSILGSSESNGDLLVRYCYPGYRRSRENETCSGSHGCCHCAEGTYMPKPNDCRHCIMKTFCHDFGLEYEDFGSSTNNSKCGEQIQKQQADGTSVSTTSGAQAVPSHHTTDILSSPSTLPTTYESEQAGISGLELWIKEHALVFAVFAFMFGVLLVLGLTCFACFCILRGRKEKRNFISSCYGLNIVEHQSDDCSSEAYKLTDNTAEEEAVET